MLLHYNNETYKICNMCNKIKSTNNFSRVKDIFRGDGYRSYCKPCNVIRITAQRLRISIYEYLERRKLKVDKLCEFCNHYFDRLVLDHNHETGVIRGWLCLGCNVHIEQNYKYEYHPKYNKVMEYFKKYEN